MSDPISAYLAAIQVRFREGDATEHSYRAALEGLLEASQEHVLATNEPSRIAGNAPDFVVRRSQTIIGHVEAKDIGVNLDKTMETEQLVRYREALPNLILTDYLEFIWFSNGEEQLRARIASVEKAEIKAAADAESQWETIASAFFENVVPTINSPKQLATILAGQTRLLRDLILAVLEKEAGTGELSTQKKAFSETLVPDLSDKEFSDMFAQTVAYGLFTAKVFDSTPEDFSLGESYALIPKANPFLRRLFHYVGSPNLTEGLRWMVEQIVDVLRHVDMESVLTRFGAKAGYEDPIFHFYETFLAEYDPKEREQRGVYYTPEPVVDFIVKSTSSLLKDKFAKEEGLAADDVVILDPAVGTATFLRKVIEDIYQEISRRGLSGAWSGYVSQKLLRRLFGFELLMAPYTVAHLKLELQLAETGFSFADDERLNIFLTNTLDRVQGKSGSLMDQWLSQESEGAEQVKEDEPVQVIVGNPPYRGESRNKSQWITQLIGLYKREPDGSALREQTSKWINNDYVKFIRFCHWKIKRTGQGIVALITAHSWIDNPTFRGMRAALLKDFSDIYILNLHGNTQKERMPEEFEGNGKDKNVFDIVQGVAITFLIAKKDADTKDAKVYSADLWGSRDFKYAYLESTDFLSVPWELIEPKLPNLLFVPIDHRYWEEYSDGWAIPEIFPENGTGIVTKCDKLSVHYTVEDAWKTVTWFMTATESEARAKMKLPKKSVRDWKFKDAQQDLRDSGPSKDLIMPILYRPLDTRYLYYTGRSRGFIGWPVHRLMKHLIAIDNRALLTSRLTKGESFAHVQVTDKPSEVICMSSKTSNNAFVFPLWLIDDEAGTTVDFLVESKRPNISVDFATSLAASLGVEYDLSTGLPHTVTPEDIFGYVYAILHCPSYRQRYEEYLRGDFPKIPLPPDISIFRSLAELGWNLSEVWLMRRDLGQSPAKFDVVGDNKVEKPVFVDGGQDSGCVYINDHQRFTGINRNVWGFRVGGYNLLEKWLKSRRHRCLTFDEIEHFQRIVLIAEYTIDAMERIDDRAEEMFV